jgi:magnesium transporter
MPKTTPSRSSKAGLPPGTLVHLGERKAEVPKVIIWQYDEDDLQEVELPSLAACVRAAKPSTIIWISLVGIHDIEVMQQIGECFGLHPLVLEDILNTDQRPKLEDYGEYLFAVLKVLDGGEEGGPSAEQVSLVLGPTYVLSFEERESNLLDPVRERIREGKGRTRKSGADYLAYCLIDTIVDRYFGVVEKLGEKLEGVEESAVASPGLATSRAIHYLKRDLMFVRKAVWPLREVAGSLQRADSPLVREGTATYLRDVYDHVIEIMDTIETYRDMVSGLLDIYLSSISNRMNEIMKVLTIIATIFIPLTFVAGVYGMNFRYMPELGWRWGYPVAMLLMALTAGGMLLYFRKRKWL